MRLWHQDLLPYLDRKRLLSQHRECCALRGKGWGKKHSVVDYVFNYTLGHLYQYHLLVMSEISRQYNYKIDSEWYNRLYRGKHLERELLKVVGVYVYNNVEKDRKPIYKEHNDKYLKECLLNLKAKGAELVNGKTIDGWLVELDLKGV